MPSSTAAKVAFLASSIRSFLSSKLCLGGRTHLRHIMPLVASRHSPSSAAAYQTGDAEQGKHWPL